MPFVASARRAETPTASTGAATWVSGFSPATVNMAAGARSHRPRHGDGSQVDMPSAIGAPAGPSVRSRSAVRSAAPASRQAMSSQTWATIGGRGLRREQGVERGDAVRLGRRDAEAAADVVERRLADPADPGLDGVECRDQEVSARRAHRARHGRRGLRSSGHERRLAMPIRPGRGARPPPLARPARRAAR